ncbi:MAG: hypothetical protein ACODAQ_08475 [Phycisphaeraceae bacterium]
MLESPLRPTIPLQRCRVTPLASRYHHCIHAYHGVDAWSRTGDYLLYIGFDDEQCCDIVMRDLDNAEETSLAHTTIFDYHTAAHHRWVLGDSAVLFYTAVDDKRCPALVEVARPGRPEPLTDLAGLSVRHVMPGGETAYGSRRLDGRDTVQRISLRAGTTETLLTIDHVLDAFPDDFPGRDLGWHFSHPVPNADESMLFVKFQRPRPWDHSGPVGAINWGGFLVLDLHNGALRNFGCRISGHPFWMNDNRTILNIKNPLDGSDNRWLVLVDALTGENIRLVDQPIEGPGHPSQSPTGELVVTDAFTFDGQHSPIYLIDLRSGTSREIVRLQHRFNPKGDGYNPHHIERGQPHPIWSPDGQQILVNCNHKSERMQLLILDHFYS